MCKLVFRHLAMLPTAGLAVTGKVFVEVLLIKKKGDMVLLNKPTTSNGNMLVSGGEIFVRLLKDGQELKLAPNAKINIRFADFPTNPNMKLFFGDESNPQQFNWIPNTNSNTDSVIAGPQMYEMFTYSPALDKC